MRSILLVSGDDDGRLDEALAAGADALLIDLPAEACSEPARLGRVCAGLQRVDLTADRPLLFVRVPSVETPGIDAVVAALVAAEPDAVVLGRSRGGWDVQHLGVKLALHEAGHDLADAALPIIAVAGTTARALFALDSYCDASSRLMGLMWDPRELAADLGLTTGGVEAPAPLATARSLLLFAARAAEVSAIDGPSDVEGDAFRTECERSRRDGFNAKVALSADQAAVINTVFDRES